MATPRGAKHTDLEQRLRDIEAELRRLAYVALRQRQLTVNDGPLVVSGGGTVVVESGGQVYVNGGQLKAWDFLNSDTATYSGTGAITVPLSYAPYLPSLWVTQNGVVLKRSEWTVSGYTLTATPAKARSGDVFTAWYALTAGTAPAAPVITPTYRAAAPQNLNGFLVPGAAVSGDLLVAVAMMSDTESVTALNGWSLVGHSDYVTHGAVGGGTRTYRLEVYSKVNDGSGAVPTVSNVAPQDVVCGMVAFSNGVGVSGVFNTLPDGTTANAPAQDPTSLRVWGSIGGAITITPSRGTQVMTTDYIEIDMAMTIDSDPTAAPATSSGAAGWAMASLAVTG